MNTNSTFSRSLVSWYGIDGHEIVAKPSAGQPAAAALARPAARPPLGQNVAYVKPSIEDADVSVSMPPTCSREALTMYRDFSTVDRPGASPSNCDVS